MGLAPGSNAQRIDPVQAGSIMGIPDLFIMSFRGRACQKWHVILVSMEGDMMQFLGRTYKGKLLWVSTEKKRL
jgi:hypothetical protein